MQTHGGKGSTPRPVNKEKFDANWDRIFGIAITVERIDSIREELDRASEDYKWLGALRGAVIHDTVISQADKNRFKRLCGD